VIVLGIDPGSIKTGYGVLELDGPSVVVRDFGVIRPSSRLTFEERLLKIHDGVLAIIREYHPAHAAVEGIFHNVRATNFRSTLKLAHARGVIVMTLAREAVPVQEITPADVKKAITGGGRAMKSQVQLMVRVLLKLTEQPQEDAADALAIALTLAQRVRSPVAGGKLRGRTR